MHYCIKRSLPVLKKVEILIVNDGSKDKLPLLRIADQYAAKYNYPCHPSENKGHGGPSEYGDGEHQQEVLQKSSIVTTGWMWCRKNPKNNYNALKKQAEEVDVFITNFVYEKKARKRRKSCVTLHSLKIKCLLGMIAETTSSLRRNATDDAFAHLQYRIAS